MGFVAMIGNVLCLSMTRGASLTVGLGVSAVCNVDVQEKKTTGLPRTTRNLLRFCAQLGSLTDASIHVLNCCLKILVTTVRPGKLCRRSLFGQNAEVCNELSVFLRAHFIPTYTSPQSHAPYPCRSND